MADSLTGSKPFIQVKPEVYKASMVAGPVVGIAVPAGAGFGRCAQVLRPVIVLHCVMTFRPVLCIQPTALIEVGMATRTTLALQDDLDGGRADLTARFSLDGSDYEIDLNIDHANAFRSHLAPFSPTPAPRSGGAPDQPARPRAASVPTR